MYIAEVRVREGVSERFLIDLGVGIKGPDKLK